MDLTIKLLENLKSHVLACEIVKFLAKLKEAATSASESANVTSVVSAEEINSLMDVVKTVHVEESLLNYMVELVQDIRSNNYIRLGPSPRASIWLHKGARAKAMFEGRRFVTPDDIKYMARYVVPHRVELNQEARYQEVSLMNILEDTLNRVAVPKGLD